MYMYACIVCVCVSFFHLLPVIMEDAYKYCLIFLAIFLTVIINVVWLLCGSLLVSLPHPLFLLPVTLAGFCVYMTMTLL